MYDPSEVPAVLLLRAFRYCRLCRRLWQVFTVSLISLIILIFVVFDLVFYCAIDYIDIFFDTFWDREVEIRVVNLSICLFRLSSFSYVFPAFWACSAFALFFPFFVFLLILITEIVREYAEPPFKKFKKAR